MVRAVDRGQEVSGLRWLVDCNLLMVRDIVVALSLQIGVNVCFLHEVCLECVDVLRTLHVIDD